MDKQTHRIIVLEKQNAELREALQRFVKAEVWLSHPNALHPSRRFCDVCGLNSKESVHSDNCRVKLAEDLLELDASAKQQETA